MKKEFMVERQGKTFVLYAGLLDMAHENGLHTVETELLQIPTAENKFVAIVRAIVVVICKDAGLCTFTGIGDAAPDNVAPPMRTCLIRMAETRSKARALRDAVNVGATSLEEMAEDDATAAPIDQAQSKPTSTSGTKRADGNHSGTEIAWLNKLERLKIKHQALKFMRFVLSEEHAVRSDENFARAMKIPDPKLKEYAANLGEPQ